MFSDLRNLCRSRIQAWLSWVCLLEVSSKTALRVSAGAAFNSGSSGERPASKLTHRTVNMILFLTVVGLRASATLWLLAGSHAQFLAMWASPQDSLKYGSLLHQIEEKPEREKEC